MRSWWQAIVLARPLIVTAAKDHYSLRAAVDLSIQVGHLAASLDHVNAVVHAGSFSVCLKEGMLVMIAFGWDMYLHHKPFLFGSVYSICGAREDISHVEVPLS